MLNLTPKTYYTLGILGTALSMCQAFFAITGTSASLLDNISLLLYGLMFCFLASIKGTPMRCKKQLVLCAILLVLSVAGRPALFTYLILAILWPYFAFIEQDGSEALRRPMQLIIGLEVANFVLRVLAGPGELTVLYLPSNVMWLLCLVARGWLLVECYRQAERNL